MFDRGYLGVDGSHRLLVSPRLRGEFGNGEQFYAKAGEVITLPDRKPDRPHREFLEWHIERSSKPHERRSPPTGNASTATSHVRSG